ncbi:reverse transcriptase [Senna tora]|uniref:Reverse transcriptase n=1 Tax=Senna tora TaxID=362788 RepID=A0A834XCK6_9FABA|nr:reverse transcriptase [Senna tora]
MCKRCGKEPECAIHTLRDCKWIKPLWKKLIHNRNWNRSSSMRKLILSTSLTMLKGMPRNPTFGWRSPKEGWFKINVDGSRFEESNKISCGGVILNSEGSWVGGFAENLGRDSIFQAEIWGAMMGLIMASDLNLHKIIIEIESSSVVNIFKDDCNNIFPFLPLADEVKNFLSKNWIVKVQHTPRENNGVANLLAWQGDNDKDEVAKVVRWVMMAQKSELHSMARRREHENFTLGHAEEIKMKSK